MQKPRCQPEPSRILWSGATCNFNLTGGRCGTSRQNPLKQSPNRHRESVWAGTSIGADRVTHCEHILAGSKLAAQIGCNPENLKLACSAIEQEGCRFIVNSNEAGGRPSIWIYKKAIAETLIRVLDKESAPSLSGAIISGKLFGYSDNEIENYVMEHFSQAITAELGSASNSLRDVDTDG